MEEAQSVSGEVRRLAAEQSPMLDRIASEMYGRLAERIPEAATDEEVAGLTLASCASNVEAILSMLRNEIPVEATEAPVTALEHARRMAARGIPVDITVRFYRIGHAFFWETWSAALADAISDREQLVAALRQTSEFCFSYIDRVSTLVSAEHLAELERRQRRAAIVRSEIVARILAGEQVDVESSRLALGHDLTKRQTALIFWSSGETTSLERAALAVAASVGTPRPLIVPDGADALGVWLASPIDLDPASTAETLARVSTRVHVAIGEPGQGVGGFIHSRRTAERAMRMAKLSSRPSQCTTYEEIALADLLSSDLELARSFAARELGGLASRDTATAHLRETVLAVIAPNGGPAAAARELGIHRNTVLQRLRRAEDLRGDAIDVRPAELHAALLLASSVGDVIE